MAIMSIVSALVAVSPVLAVAIILSHFLLSVWSGQRVIHYLRVSRATRTIERCDRWAIECDEARSSNGAQEGKKSWWRRGLSHVTRPFSRWKRRRCDASTCEATGDAEVCPTYVEQLRLLTSDVPPADTASPAPARPPSSKSSFGAFFRGVLSKSQAGVGTTVDRVLVGGSKAGGIVGRGVGRVAKGTWRKMRRGAAATPSVEFDDKNVRGRGRSTKAKPAEKRDGSSGSSESSKRPRFAFFRFWRRFRCRQAPAMFNPTSNQEAKLLSAKRALGVSDLSALQLSFRLNVLALTMIGLWVYVKRKGRVRSQRRRQSRQRRRPLGERDRAGVAPSIGSDSGDSSREGSSMKLEPRPLALPTFLDSPPPDEVPAAAQPSAAAPPPAAALVPCTVADDIERDRNGEEMKRCMQGQEEQKCSLSPRSERGRTSTASGRPQQQQHEQQQQQYHQQARPQQMGQCQPHEQHLGQQQNPQGGAERRAFPPAGSNRAKMARPNRHNISGRAAAGAITPPAVRAAAESAASREESYDRAVPLPGDLALGVFLFSVTSVTIVDVFAALVYALRVASSSPASSPSLVPPLSPTLTLFLTVVIAGPATAVTFAVRVFCFCKVPWVTEQLGLRPFQLRGKVRLRRMRDRSPWRSYWRQSLTGADNGTTGIAGGTSAAVGVGRAIDPGDTHRSWGGIHPGGALGAGGAIGAGGTLGSVAALDDADDDGGGGSRQIGLVGNFGEGREHSRCRSRSPGRRMTADRARVLRGARSPGRPSIHGHRGWT